MDKLNTVADGLDTLLASYTEPCIGDCDHSQCPLLRELHALRIKATLEKARLTVKPTVDRELQAEQIGDLMNMRLDSATPRATGETTVEGCLAELREMFPAKLRGNKNGRSIFVEYTEHGHGRRSGDSDICKTALIHVEYATDGYSAPLVIKGDSLADCMAQVRAAAQTKAERGRCK
jgi:hypothetical protein